MIKPIDNTDGDSDLKIKQKCFLYVFHNDVRFGLQTPTSFCTINFNLNINFTMSCAY